MNIFSLDNGLQYILEQQKNTGVIAVQVWVKTGSIYEEQKIAGITHFIEHLIFKGTDKVKANEMASKIESLGGNINAFTSHDNTVYHVVIPKNAFEEGFTILVDAVKNPAFPEDEIAKEKKVVLEEIKMGEDDPQRKLFKELFSLSYEDNPYGRPIIGYEDTVKDISRDDIRQYFKTHYTPDNMVLVITGDFEEAKADELIKKHFAGDNSRDKATLENKKDNDVTGNREKIKIIEKNIKESYLAFSYNVPSITHEDIPALEVLGTILGEGESSRLQKQLKNKKGIVTDSSTYLFNPKGEGLFVFYATFKGKDYPLIIAEIEKEVSVLRKEGPTPSEIQKAKNMIKASYVYSIETVQGKARQVGNFQTLTGDPYFVDKFLAKIDQVNRDDIIMVMDKYISGKYKALAALLPKSASNPYTFQLKNGLKCVVNKEQASPTFAFRAGFIGGVKEEAPGKNGIFNVLSKMLLKGTKDKDATKIAQEIDFLAGNVSAFSGKNTFGLSGKFLSKDIEEVFGLLKDLLTSTSLKEDELKKVKEDVLSEIRQQDDDPVGYTFIRFNEILYKGHPYSRDPVGREPDIGSIKLDELEGVYKKFITPSNAVLAISGDVDEKKIESLFRKMFSDWSGEASFLQNKPVSAVQKSIQHIDKEIVQTHLVFGFLGPGVLSEDRYAVEVMDSVLSGMGGRIHKILREEKPYAYALTFFNQMAYEVGGMGIYIGTDKKLTEEVRKIVYAEIERILSEGFTEKEVEDAKRYLIGTHYIHMQANSVKAMSMCLDTIYRGEPGYFKVWPKHIQAIKKEDVDKAARKYLSIDKMVDISVGGRP
ncbi:MAG: pitrilysin family protein [Proteobacteria bacterium]|nr:pitrilysin family protein [Pseudomonadota bacterium]